MNLISGTYHSCERREHAFMVLREYTIISLHRELGKVADGTSTQVRVQMINKWMVKMIQKRLYKIEYSS